MHSANGFSVVVGVVIHVLVEVEVDSVAVVVGSANVVVNFSELFRMSLIQKLFLIWLLLLA